MGSLHIEKRCSACDTVKPVSEFYKAGHGRDHYCKTCRRKKDRARSEKSSANRKKLQKDDPLYFRRKKLVKMYGITHEQWLEMYAQQNGVCAMCGKPETRVLYGGVAHLVVDHDHATGKKRALLCHRCNSGLGRIEDVEFFMKALRYLQRFSPTVKVLAVARDVQKWIELYGGGL